MDLNNGYHFIIKELAKEIGKEFICKHWKYINFTIPVEGDVTWIDKNGEKCN